MGFWSGLKNTLFGGEATNSIDPTLRNYDSATGSLGQIAQNAASRQAPTVQGTQLDPSQMGQSRAGMMGVADRLGGIASGRTVGAGEMAVNRQIGSALAAQQSAARSARGANAALAMRNAARNSADIGIGGAGQAAQAQMQDQQGANQQLGQIYGSMYGQDANVAQANAQLGQQANLANQQAQLANQQQNDAAQLAAYNQQLAWDQARVNAQVQRAGIATQDKGIFPSLLQQGGQIGAAFAASDERLKTDLRDAGADADEFMSALRPVSYRYTDEERWGSGHRLGITAQDLARSKLGRSAVVAVDDRGHLGYDMRAATGATMAAVARLHERLSKLEGR